MSLKTITSGDDINRLFKTGIRLKTPYLIFIVGNDEEHDRPGRVAFIAGKKLGNAVWRNRAKRIMRGICRELHGPWHGYDVIFLAKSSITDATYSKVLQTCETLLVKKGIAVYGETVEHTEKATN